VFGVCCFVSASLREELFPKIFPRDLLELNFLISNHKSIEFPLLKIRDFSLSQGIQLFLKIIFLPYKETIQMTLPHRWQPSGGKSLCVELELESVIKQQERTLSILCTLPLLHEHERPPPSSAMDTNSWDG
jgi:hypothetical protein